MRSRLSGNWATEKKKKKVAGRQVTAYTGNAAILSSSLSTKKWPAQKETKIAAMDMKREVNPAKGFLGNSLPKSFSSYLDVRIARNVTVEVTKEQRAMSDEIAKIPNAVCYSRFDFVLPSLVPPGTVVDVAKATVAMSVATNENVVAVLFSHCPPFCTRSLCSRVKICFADSFSFLWKRKKFGGMDFFTYCHKM
ncbi:hypothetical protein PVL29_017238 [Vitis rotundifolia]|uniref:Uncharacterized protein n=1 Tax=Vitis rotundifolia TaxID=103349 RepID=A0AA38Z9X2_VITRO|nr:hypothetical protein PVL29_017238 [Vitis rotundifolia]